MSISNYGKGVACKIFMTTGPGSHKFGTFWLVVAKLRSSTVFKTNTALLLNIGSSWQKIGNNTIASDGVERFRKTTYFFAYVFCFVWM